MAIGVFHLTHKVLVRRGDTFLVLRDAVTGFGDLPGGRMAPGEIERPWADCVQRELAEELGPGVIVALEAEPRFWFPHRIPTTGHEALGFLWVGAWQAGEVVLSDEHDGCAWQPVTGWDPANAFRDHLLGAVRRALTLPWEPRVVS